jgi:hypothetical protein
LQSEHDHHLGEVGKAEKRVIGLFNAELLLSGSVANDDDEKEIAEDVPVKIVEVGRVGVKELTDDGGGVLDQGVAGHDIEEGEISGEACPALLDELDHRGDVGHLRSERGRDGRLCLRKRQPNIRLLQGTAIVGAVATHRHRPSSVLVDHHYLGLVVGLSPRVNGSALQELDLQRAEIFNSPLKQPIEGIASDTELGVDAFRVRNDPLHVRFGRVLIIPT